MKVLGIDPGLATVGIGIVESDPIKIIDYCTIETDKGLTLPQRLLEIADDLAEIVREHKPDLAVVEKLFFQTNRKTAIDVAEARGVILVTLEEAGVSILEPTPLQIKSAITGDGRADKKQIQDMLKRMFNEDCASDDAADALAMAVYGSLHAKEVSLVS